MLKADDDAAGREQPYRADIDGLRALAVSAVVAFHAFPRLLPGGFIGVDVFFVISGYLITRLISSAWHEQRFSLGRFYRQRVRRILPALLVVMMACCAFGWFALLPNEFARLGQSLSWCAALLPNVFFARAGEYFAPVSELTPLLHLWSLGVEEQFYLFWPVLMLLALHRARLRAVLVLLLAGSLAISLYGAWHAPPKYFFLLPSRAWELGCGALLATHRNGQPLHAGHRLAAPASTGGLLLIAAGAVLLRAQLAFPGAWGLIPCSGAVLLIAAGPAAPVNRLLLSSAPLVWLGRISYPLYLWHWPIFAFAHIALGRTTPAWLALSLIALALLLAQATYDWIETPFRRRPAQLRPMALLLTCCASLVVLGAEIERFWVIPRLNTPALLQWQQRATDWHVPLRHEPDGMYTVAIASQPGHTVLFVGDSHVQQLWARARRVIDQQPGRARSALFMTYIGCPPLPGLNSTHRGAACDRQFAHVLERARQADIDTIVFGAFWEYYLQGEFDATPAPWNNDHIYSLRDRLRSTVSLDSPALESALDEFAHTLRTLVTHAHRVVLLLSYPTSPRFEPLYLLPVSARLMPPAPDQLQVDARKRSVDARAFEIYVAPLMARLRAVALRSGASVIDPRDWFCDGLICTAVDSQGAPTHVDSNHLTTSYVADHARFVDGLLLGAKDSTPTRVADAAH